MELFARAAATFRDLQDEITAALEVADGGAVFREDTWQRPGGGGGRSRVLSNGALFEKAGVGFSEVYGELRPELAAALPGDGNQFRAVGVSLVLHPRSPRVPTVHANFRRIERGQLGWFGGGSDLTPYYVVAEDAAHFHRTWKAVCDAHDPALFPRWKRACDEYFFLPHRGEPRGVGGIFFDNLTGEPEATFALVKDAGQAFLPAYLPIVERRRSEPWGERERHWQLVRRGRYVEFNLLYDRGTIFGLRTDGRVESILMSLPPEVRWLYDHQPEPGSPEAAALAEILARRDWANAPG